jgi:hypothetical protein
MFAGLAPEKLLHLMGKIHVGRPVKIKTRRELLATLKPNHLRHMRPDNGDLPEGFDQLVASLAAPEKAFAASSLTVLS